MELLIKFHNEILKTKAQNTAQAYYSRVSTIIKEHPDGISGINQEMIDSYNSSAKTKSTTHAQFIYACKAFNEYIGFNYKFRKVIAKHDFVKQRILAKKGFDFERIKNNINYTKERNEIIYPRNKALIYLMYYTGVRIGEAQSLKTEHIDFMNGSVFIQGQKSRDRTIPLNENLADALLDYVEKKDFDSEYFFLAHGRNSSNNNLVHGVACQTVKKILVNSGYPEQSSKIFRDAFISNLFKNGAYIEDIHRIAGHENYGVLDHYFIGDRSGKDAIMRIK